MISELNKDVYVFDLDGTVYIEDNPIEGVSNVINCLRSQNKKLFFLSNNSSKSKEVYIDRLQSMDINATNDEVILSTDSVIKFLNQRNIDNVYVVGTAEMQSELYDAGINPAAENPSHVVVGFDRELTYEKLRKASYYLTNGAGFIAANPDRFCPTPEGPIPDSGSIIALLETATGRSPDRILGKPDSMMLEPIYERANCPPAEIVMIGDRLETDIQMANAEGVTSVCVLSGDATEDEIATTTIKPDFVFDSAAGLLADCDKASNQYNFKI